MNPYVRVRVGNVRLLLFVQFAAGVRGVSFVGCIGVYTHMRACAYVRMGSGKRENGEKEKIEIKVPKMSIAARMNLEFGDDFPE